jgi:hypothetical protein
LLAGVLDVLRVGLLLQMRLRAILRHEAQASRNRQHQHRPPRHLRQVQWQQSFRFDAARVLRGVRHHQRLPIALLRRSRDLKRRAQAFLEILLHVHPTRRLLQRRFAPCSGDRAHRDARKTERAANDQREEGQGEKFESHECDQPNETRDENALCRAAHRPRQPPPPRRACERRLDGLQLAHLGWNVPHSRQIGESHFRPERARKT